MMKAQQLTTFALAAFALMALSGCPTVSDNISVTRIIQTPPPDNTVSGAVTDFEVTLTDGTAHEWDITEYGYVADGEHTPSGTDDAFDDYIELSVGGTAYPAVSQADLQDQEEIVFGPETIQGLDVTRKVFVSGQLGFARWLDILENPSGSDITVAVQVEGNLGSDESNNDVAGSTDGNTSLDPTDLWYSNCQDRDDPCVGHFWCGAEGSKSGDSLTMDYGMVTVPANSRVILVNYVLMRTLGTNPTNEVENALTGLEQFPLVDPRYLHGMNTGELNDSIDECGGGIEVTGGMDSVGAGAMVTVTNDATGDSRMTTAGSNGAWSLAIAGTTGDTLTVSATSGESAMVTVP